MYTKPLNYYIYTINKRIVAQMKADIPIFKNKLLNHLISHCCTGRSRPSEYFSSFQSTSGPIICSNDSYFTVKYPDIVTAIK